MLLQKLSSRVLWRPALAALPPLQHSSPHSAGATHTTPVAFRQHLSAAKGPAVNHLRATGVTVRPHAPMSTQASGKAAGEPAGMGAMVVYITCGNDESGGLSDG